jgi:hypothetical protein
VVVPAKTAEPVAGVLVGVVEIQMPTVGARTAALTIRQQRLLALVVLQTLSSGEQQTRKVVL